MEKNAPLFVAESAIHRRRNPEEGFRSLFFLKEIPLPMETVPGSRTGPVSSLSAHGIPRSSLVILNILLPPSPPPSSPSVLLASLFLPRFHYGGWCIVPTLRCVYALSTLIMNASVSFTARVLTRRAVHGRSTLRKIFFLMHFSPKGGIFMGRPGL